MFLFRSNYTGWFREFAEHLRTSLSLILPLLILILFYLNKTLLVSPQLFLIALFIVFNATVLLRRLVMNYLVIAFYTATVFLHTLLHFLNIPANMVNYTVDSLIILTILFTYMYYYHYHVSSLERIFQPHIPFIVLASTIIGVYLGVDFTLRLLSLTVVDVLVSTIVASATRSKVYQYASSLLFFALLYISPVVDVELKALLVFLVLHFARNHIAFSNRHKRLAGTVLTLDLLLKPIVVTLA